jgi:NTP pyrophosphatase (non-canonical NTP hydrolase)
MIRPELQWFVQQMEQKLKENDHKQHWNNYDIDYLIHRIYEEQDELEIAITQKLSAKEIIKECADVANFAMMIADNVSQRNE